jgi:COP9 signalosome complex subunit 7
VYITALAPLRDLRPGSTPQLLSILATWSARCTSTIASLEAQIAGIRTAATKRAHTMSTRQAVVTAAVEAQMRSSSNMSAKAAGGTVDNFVPTSQSSRTVGSGRVLRGRGNKRDLSEQLEDDEFYDEGSSGGDGGVGNGVARMEVDEGGRGLKRISGERGGKKSW